MTRAIRVMIADDSTVTRRILGEAISRETDMMLVGAATNGEEAIALFRSHKPDVALLDVEMPVINGIEALRSIRATGSQAPIVMFSTLTVRGAEATLDALSAGATDYVAKPTGVGHVDKAIEFLKTEVIPKLRLWGNRFKSQRESAPKVQKDAVAIRPAGAAVVAEPRRTAVVSTRKRSGQANILAIGSSTGGPNALADVMSRLPSDLSIPVVIAQHMPPIFTQLLAERLDRCSKLKVREGFDGAVLKPGEVWVAPGDFHMTVARQGTSVVLKTNQAPPENSCRPSVDVLFRSVAEVYGGNSLAVVLTGMGKDGAAGCVQLSQLGATILAQDEQSSVVWGMPRAVYEAGVADALVPLNEMHTTIMTRLRSSVAVASA
ncbi:MAG: chemotaxis response regulator protein-glutamate methylesterase [Planctomyces sp.]|nr:chemotaxis response regulator protein-glutamate methylesterase [Planctomyces sp.]